MKLLYVAGPYRGANNWEIEKNIRRAESLALEVWRMGIAAICPHANTRYFQGAADDNLWLEGDLEMLRRCDGVVLTDGWQRSHGTRAEVREALNRDIPVFESLIDVAAWFNAGSRWKTDPLLKVLAAAT